MTERLTLVTARNQILPTASSLDMNPEPQGRIIAPADTWIPTCETLSQESSYALPGPLILGTNEMINVCHVCVCVLSCSVVSDSLQPFQL